MTTLLRRFRRVAVGFVWGPDTTPETADQRARTGTIIGLSGVSIVLLALGVIHAIGTTAFAPPDETSHVAYSFAVTEWRIPHIADFPDDLPIPGMNPGLSVWTANHPPGTYALMAVPLELGVAMGAPLAGLRAARLMNLIAVIATLWVIARIVATLVPHRPRIIVGTAMIAGLMPFFVHVSAIAYTDGLALLPTVGILAVATDVIVRGPTRGRLWWMLGLAAACALSRSTGMVAVLFAGSAWGVGELLHGTDAWLARVRRGVGFAALIGFVAFVAGGWFYIGNIGLYGDPSGSQALFELHSREPRGTTVEYFFRMGYQQLVLWSGVEGLPNGAHYFVIPGGWVQQAEPFFLMIVAGATVSAGVHWGRVNGRVDRARSAVWAMMLLWLLTLYLLMAAFTAGGGSPHPRYYWPAFFVIALVLSLGLDLLRVPVPRGRRELGGSIPVGLVGALGILAWAQTRGWPRALELFGAAGPDQTWLDAVVESFQIRQIPAASTVAGLTIGLLAVGLVVTVGSLLALPVHSRGGVALDAAEPEPATDDRREDEQEETDGEEPVGAVH